MGGAGRRVARPRRHRPRPRPRRSREGRGGPRRSFDEISNGGPGIETLLPPIVYSEGVARGRVGIERMVDILSTTPARLVLVSNGKGALEVGRSNHDVVIFDPGERRGRSKPTSSTTRPTTRPTRASSVRGAVRDVLVRGTEVIRAGAVRRPPRRWASSSSGARSPAEDQAQPLLGRCTFSAGRTNPFLAMHLSGIKSGR